MPDMQAQGRFSLNETGAIFWQADVSNPLPGTQVGHITKAGALLQPAAVMDDEALSGPANDFLAIHIRQVLEPLFALLQSEGEGALSGPALGIGQKLFDGLGVVHRSELEAEIAALDSDMRKALRGKGVRLGPVLVFVPALVKPAAIRMRAMLWALWNDKPLPVALPADGRVSDVVDAQAIDRNFYRMIGYPVFGPRAIRIDMLDRVVTDIYDSADKGVFEAKHKYAEWFGCGLDDLHAILESMGHRKYKERAGDAADLAGEAIDDVAAEDVASEAAVEAVVEAVEVAVEEAVVDAVIEQAVVESAVETAVESVVEGAEKTPEVVAEVGPEVKAEALAQELGEKPGEESVKAPLVVQKFFLKKGKMSDRPQSNRARAPQNNRSGSRSSERSGHWQNTQTSQKDAPVPRKAYDPNRPQGRKDGSGAEGKKGDYKPKRHKGDKAPRRDEPRVFTFEGKKSEQDDANNPFAILKQLQK